MFHHNEIKDNWNQIFNMVFQKFRNSLLIFFLFFKDLSRNKSFNKSWWNFLNSNMKFEKFFEISIFEIHLWIKYIDCIEAKFCSIQEYVYYRERERERKRTDFSENWFKNTNALIMIFYEIQNWYGSFMTYVLVFRLQFCCNSLRFKIKCPVPLRSKKQCIHI